MKESTKRRDVVVRLKIPPARRLRGHHVGILVGRAESGPVVDYEGNPHGPLTARTTTSFDGVAIDPSRPTRVLLVFEQERSDEPIVVGILEPKDADVAASTPDDAPTRNADAQKTGVRKIEARIDGRRVVEAEDELELRCGEATLTLRRNGRVVIRGVYIETRSRGVNRIKGGTVQIN